MNKTVLCIIDGLGINPDTHGNAVLAADMKNLWSAYDKYPSINIVASGQEVGLVSEKDAGNSEVGHNAIGAGKRIKQGLALLNEVFETGEVFESKSWKLLAENAKKSKLNITILLSEGRIHSNLEHLYKVLERCGKEKIKVAIHAVADGVDVGTQSVLEYIKKTRECIDRVGVDAKIAVVGGRGVIFMDRYEANLPAMARAFEASVEGKGVVTKDIENSVNELYEKNPSLTDASMQVFILEPDWLIKNGDSVLHLNFRGDRSVQTCQMFEHGKYLTKEQFAKIDNCVFAGALEYDTEQGIPKNFLCPPPKIENTLTEWLCKFGVRQFSVTETAKFGHLTYFFNGNRAKPVDVELETWLQIPSDELGMDFSSKPKMQAQKITDETLKAIKSDKYDFIKLNLPNPDMVGHSGNFDAVVEGTKEVDKCLGQIVDVCKSNKTNLIILSDHGNAEEMLDDKGKPKPSHTNNVVPFIIMPFASDKQWKIKNGEFGLTNIAATICELLDIQVSEHFNGGIIES